MDFWQNINWFLMLKCFIVGGLICIIGQILIDKTKLTPARILVAFVTIGAILGGLGIYQKLIDFAGCGATVPLTGFGNALAKGAIELSSIIGSVIGLTLLAPELSHLFLHPIMTAVGLDEKNKSEKTNKKIDTKA